MTDVVFMCEDTTDSKLTIKVNFTDGNWWAIDFHMDSIFVYDYATNTSKFVQLS